jgi:hypothetical protein
MEHWIQALAVFIVLTSCSEENACLKRAGDPVTFVADANTFNKLELHNAIEVELIQHEDTLVEISTGENLKNFISLDVTDETLIIRDNNMCNWIRDYNKTSIKIYHPAISAITHLGNNRIFSSDTLYYPSLMLFSKNRSGDFDLIIRSSKIRISINDVSNVYLSGKTDELYAGIYSGDGRIEAEDLYAKNVSFFHRGTNDMLLYPTDILQGELVGIGNVIYYNEPSNISVEDNGPGQLIKHQ